jgi:hypothetical protein
MRLQTLTAALLFSTVAIADTKVVNEHLSQGHHVCCDRVYIPEHPVPPIGRPIPIDHPPIWHGWHHGHIHPVCSCIGIDHIPLDRLRIYEPQE